MPIEIFSFQHPKTGFFKYEDFFNKPNDVLKQMCEILKLNTPMNIQKI